MSATADRNLLFGIVALQFDFITRDQLIAGMSAWALAKHRPLADILQEHGALSAGRRKLLDPLVEEHIHQHNDDPQQSLAAVSSVGSVKEQLQSIGDRDIDASLPVIASARHEMDAYATIAAGQSTSAGTRFRILRPHAVGGLGVVRVANDEELNREVALKEIKPEHAHSGDSRVRFLREAEITGGLEHPSIVPVYGLGSYPDGRPFYAMRFIKGDSLAEAIQEFHADGKNPHVDTEKNLQLRKLLQRFIDVCDALEYAHSRGVFHRDLKPGNIMLGKYGETLVVDWGLAKSSASDVDMDTTLPLGADPLLKPRSGDSTDATRMGSVLGTPKYMPPEQAEGRLDLFSPASDVYSLGATLYALLTAHAPVEGKTTEDVLANVRNGNIVPPHQRVPTIPRPLAAICTKALAFAREDRYASAKDLAFDVERYLADEPVVAYREPALVRIRRWGRKHPAGVSATMAALIVGLLAAGIGTFVLAGKNQELREKEAISRAVKDFLLYDLLQMASAEQQSNAGIRIDPETKVRDLLQHADQKIADRFPDKPEVQEELQSLVTRALESVAPNTTIRSLVLRGSQSIEGRFIQQPLLEAEICSTLGMALRSVGEFSAARTVSEHALKLRQVKLGPEHPDTLHSVNDLANSYFRLGQRDEALQLLEQTLKLRAANLGPDHPDTLRSMNNLALAYLGLGRLDEAVPICQQTLKLRQANLGPEHPDTLQSMNSLALAYRYAGRLDEALPLLEQTLKLRQTTLGPEHPHTLYSMNDLALAYSDAGRLDEALPLHEQTLKLTRAKLGSEHPDTLQSMNSLAITYRDGGRLDEALQLFEQTLKLRENKLGPEHTETLESMNDLAIAYSDAGRLDEALPLFQQTLKIRQAKLGPEHPDTLRSMINLAVAYQDARRLDEALPLYEQTLKLRQANLGPEHPDTLQSMNDLAFTYQDAGRLDEALPLYEQTLKLRQAKLGTEHPDTLQSMNDLALTYQDAGRLDDALSLFQQTLKIRQAKLGPENPDTLQSMHNLAVAYQDAGRLDEALPLHEQTLKLRQANLGPEHPDSLHSMNKLALTYQDAGRLDEALPLHKQTLKIRQAKLGPEHPDTLRSMINLAFTYQDAGRLDEALPLFQQTLKLRQATIGPEHPDTVRTIFGIGLVVFALRQFDRAEEYLLQGYAATNKLPSALQEQARTDFVHALVDLYDAWDKPEEAAKWRKKLAE